MAAAGKWSAVGRLVAAVVPAAAAAEWPNLAPVVTAGLLLSLPLFLSVKSTKYT